jgi:hypothetical protein
MTAFVGTARLDGVSMNQFINIAITEKVSRLEAQMHNRPGSSVVEEPRLAHDACSMATYESSSD